MWLLLLFNGSGFVYLVGIALDGCGLAYEYCFGCQWFVVSSWYCLWWFSLGGGGCYFLWWLQFGVHTCMWWILLWMAEFFVFIVGIALNSRVLVYVVGIALDGRVLVYVGGIAYVGWFFMFLVYMVVEFCCMS